MKTKGTSGNVGFPSISQQMAQAFYRYLKNSLVIDHIQRIVSKHLFVFYLNVHQRSNDKPASELMKLSIMNALT